MALLAETAVRHLLTNLWSAQVADKFSFFDSYPLVVLAAHGPAVRLQPVSLTADTLQVCYAPELGMRRWLIIEIRSRE